MLRRIAQNWELKVISVLMAFALWAFVATSDKSEIVLAVPVEYYGLGTSTILVGDHRETVDVHLRSVRWAVARLAHDSLRLKVNLAHVHEGESVVQLTPDQMDVPPGVTVTRITPSRLRIVLAHATTAVVRVVPQLRGAPAAGFAVRGVVVDPPTVEIKGPRSTIEGRGVVDTVPLGIGDSRSNLTEIVGLMLPDGAYLTREQAVHVTVEIAPEGPTTQTKKGAGR